MVFGKKADPCVQDKLWQQRCAREVYAQTRPVYEKYWKNSLEREHRPSQTDSQDTAQELISGFKRVRSSPSLAGSDVAPEHVVVLPRRDSKASYAVAADLQSVAASASRHGGGGRSSAASSAVGSTASRLLTQSEADRRKKSTRGGLAAASNSAGTSRTSALRDEVASLVQQEVKKLLEPITEELHTERERRKSLESELSERMATK
mmetsp:Transcript_23262/g.58836  ORF Transcript_23262/g.58836 Transcript_23262/m.58836 type:complete len:206 (+) Transcript_23262:154-771(+)